MQDGYLLQIFMRPIQDRPTVFLEAPRPARPTQPPQPAPRASRPTPPRCPPGHTRRKASRGDGAGGLSASPSGQVIQRAGHDGFGVGNFKVSPRPAVDF